MEEVRVETARAGWEGRPMVEERHRQRPPEADVLGASELLEPKPGSHTSSLSIRPTQHSSQGAELYGWSYQVRQHSITTLQV